MVSPQPSAAQGRGFSGSWVLFFSAACHHRCCQVGTAGQGWTLRRPARQGPWLSCGYCCCQADRCHHSFCSGDSGLHGEGLFRSLLLPLALQRRCHPLRGRVHLAGKLASGGYLNAVTPSHLVHVLEWYHRGVSLSTPVQVTANSRTGHHRRPLVRCWLAPQEQQFPVGVKKNLSYHLITKNSNGLFL